MTTVEEALDGARARALAAENRLRAQTMLRAEAEHRLKTTLAVITGWAVTLDDRWEQLSDERRREAVGVIRRASQDLAVQADGMLDHARAEFLTLDQEPSRLDLGAVLGVTAAVFGGMGGHVVEAVTPRLPVLVDVDPAALQQVLGHLLENAVKYSPPRSRVLVSLAAVGDEAMVDISDEGCGVPEGVDLFEAFQRGPDTDALPGVGLGPSIVRNLVHGMGGQVSCRANEGLGSTFTVRLPALGVGTKDPGVVDAAAPMMAPCPPPATGTDSRS